MASYLATLWNRGLVQLGKGPLVTRLAVSCGAWTNFLAQLGKEKVHTKMNAKIKRTYILTIVVK